MKVQTRHENEERRILIGMVVDRGLLARVSPRWEGELFRSRWANLIGGWCVTFYQKYGKAPNKTVQSLFDSWAAKNGDNETIELVDKFLSSLSNEYAQLKRDSNTEYLIDLAARYFNRIKLSRLTEAVSEDLEAGDVDKAQKRVATYGRVEMGKGGAVEPLKDKEALRRAFESKREPLIKYPGALGTFFSDSLERDGFVAFMGAEKKGKTWWLLDIAWRAVLQNRRVAFFEVGDMSESQIMLRFASRAAKRPVKAGTVKYPTYLEVGDNGPEVTHKDKIYAKPLRWQRAWKACEEITKTTDGTLLRLSVHPNSSLSVLGVKAILADWEREGWVPDVVVIDYADILDPPIRSAESRDQTNATWKQLRSLSQDKHCLVITATQANAASYRAETVDRSNFSEDKRKLAHVTGMVGINVSTQEKRDGLCRLNWVVLRESEFMDDQCVYVAGCLGLGNPAIKSSF